jgi:hypothetical protein
MSDIECDSVTDKQMQELAFKSVGVEESTSHVELVHVVSPRALEPGVKEPFQEPQDRRVATAIAPPTYLLYLSHSHKCFADLISTSIQDEIPP